MARQDRAALADLRALEEQTERANPIAPSRRRKQVSGAGATPSMGLSQHRGGRRTRKAAKVPSLAVMEADEAPSIHNLEEDAIALMPSGEYDGAGKHTLLDHLAAPMKGFGEYLHAFESGEAPAVAKAKKVLPGATRKVKGGVKTGRYEGLGTGGASREDSLMARLMGPVGSTTTIGFSPNAPEVSDSKEEEESVMSAPSEAPSPPTVSKKSKPSSKKTGKGATPSMGLSQFRGGMAFGQVVGSGKAEAEDDLAAAVGGRRKRAAAGPDDGRRKRAAVVRKVMADRGCSMIEASKIVKAEGLY